MFDSNMFTLLAEAEVGKHFYWNLAGFLVHGQVLAVIWFVVILLLIFAFLLFIYIKSRNLLLFKFFII